MAITPTLDFIPIGIESTSNINNPINILKNRIGDPTKGLPEDLFQFISSIFPLVNVDLMIRDQNNRILLSWRNDDIFKNLWHFPGRILRFKDSLKQCAYDLIKNEIKHDIILNECLLEWNEIIENHPERDNVRSHFISFLYEGFLD